MLILGNDASNVVTSKVRLAVIWFSDYNTSNNSWCMENVFWPLSVWTYKVTHTNTHRNVEVWSLTFQPQKNRKSPHCLAILPDVDYILLSVQTNNSTILIHIKTTTTTEIAFFHPQTQIISLSPAHNSLNPPCKKQTKNSDKVLEASRWV